jgi:hypothetical protein
LIDCADLVTVKAAVAALALEYVELSSDGVEGKAVEVGSSSGYLDLFFRRLPMRQLVDREDQRSLDQEAVAFLYAIHLGHERGKARVRDEKRIAGNCRRLCFRISDELAGVLLPQQCFSI